MKLIPRDEGEIYELEWEKTLREFRKNKELRKPEARLGRDTNGFSNKFLVEVDLFIESMKNIKYDDKKAEEIDKQIVELAEKGDFVGIVMKAIETDEKYMRICESFLGVNECLKDLKIWSEEEIFKWGTFGKVDIKKAQLEAAGELEKKSYFFNYSTTRLTRNKLIPFARDCSVFPLLEDSFKNMREVENSIAKFIRGMGGWDWLREKEAEEHTMDNCVKTWVEQTSKIYKLMSKIFLSATNPGFCWSEDPDLKEFLEGEISPWERSLVEVYKSLQTETWNKFKNVFVYNTQLKGLIKEGNIEEKHNNLIDAVTKTLRAITTTNDLEKMSIDDSECYWKNVQSKRKVEMKDLMLILNTNDLEEINKNKELDLSKEISQGLSVYGDCSVNSGNYKVLRRGMFIIFTNS